MQKTSSRKTWQKKRSAKRSKEPGAAKGTVQPLKTKKELSRELTMRKLLDAGLHEFANHGFDGTSTKMVAKRAKVNEALIFRYFSDKAGLLAALIVEKIRESEGAESPYLKGQTPADEVFNCLMNQYRHDFKFREFLKVAISRALVDRRIEKMVTDHVPINGNPLLTERLIELKKQGLLARHVEPEALSQMVCIFGAGIMMSTTAVEILEPKEVEPLIRSFAKQITA